MKVLCVKLIGKQSNIEVETLVDKQEVYKTMEAYKSELDTIGLQTWVENAQAAYDRMK